MTLPPRNGMTSKSKSDATGGAVADALAFSALFPAAIAFTFSLVSSRALDSDLTSREKLHFAVLAAAGSFVVYGIDRLRDRQRDRQTSPLRTAFTDQYATAIVSATGLAGLILLISLATAPLRIGLLCAAVLPPFVAASIRVGRLDGDSWYIHGSSRSALSARPSARKVPHSDN